MKYFLLKLILVLSSVTLCLSEDNQYTRIELKRQKTPREQQLNYIKYLKYGFKSPMFGKKHHKGNNGTIDTLRLRKYLDNEFYGTAVIGHPGQIFNVAFDTTWSHTWIMSSRCNSVKSIGCYLHNLYDHSKSSEYKPDGKPFLANEGSYNLTGFYSYDNISMAHSNVTNQSFIEIVSVPYSFIYNKADGILGLGLKTDDYEPFFYGLIRQKKINESIFSIFLNRDPHSTAGGNIYFGYVNKHHIHCKKVNGLPIYDKINYYSAYDLPYWQVDMKQVVFHSNTILCSGECKAIFDTSTNTIVGPSDAVKAIHDVIGAHEAFENRYLVNCDMVNTFPRIDFILNQQNYTLKGSNYVTKLTYKSTTVCLSAFEPSDSLPKTWVLGASFLANYYSIYNIKDKTVGLVKTP